MTLSIKNKQAEKLAREVVKETGETITQAIIRALEERLEMIRGRRTVSDTFKTIMEISRRCSSMPDLDNRSPEKILGYDEAGSFRGDLDGH